MFRRIISAGRGLVPIWFSPGMPVRKIVTRSFRGVGGVFSPNSAWSSGGTVGFVTKPSAAPSPVGSSPLNVSFTPRGITASLTSGMPSRDTCTKSPLDTALPGVLVVVAGRLAVDHTPIDAFGIRRARR